MSEKQVGFYGNKKSLGRTAPDHMLERAPTRKISFLYRVVCIRSISTASLPILTYVSSPYLVFTRSSSSSMGSAANHRNSQVAAAWMQFMGKPDT